MRIWSARYMSFNKYSIVLYMYIAYTVLVIFCIRYCGWLTKKPDKRKIKNLKTGNSIFFFRYFGHKIFLWFSFYPVFPEPLKKIFRRYRLYLFILEILKHYWFLLYYLYYPYIWNTVLNICMNESLKNCKIQIKSVIGF